jgi:hypothetical protein
MCVQVSHRTKVGGGVRFGVGGVLRQSQDALSVVATSQTWAPEGRSMLLISCVSEQLSHRQM